MQKKDNAKSRIGKTSFLKGVIKFKNDLLIEGKFEGEINSSGSLILNEESQVDAIIKVGNVYNYGTLKGEFDLNGDIELHRESKTYGNIRANAIKIVDGAIFEGKCEMIDQAEKIDVFFQSIEELRDAIKKEREKNLNKVLGDDLNGKI